MSEAERPRDLGIAPLCDRCRAETERYRRGEAHDDRYCYELIRRAIELRDDHCWRELIAIYRDLVLSWCRRSGGADGDIEELAAVAWEKFWRNYTPAKLTDANGSAAAPLGYLKACARSAVLDEGRRRARLQAHELADPESVHAFEAAAEMEIDHADGDAFWSLIDGHLRDERERLIVRLSYEIGLTPADIYARHGERFADVREVYKIKRNILDRLRRSRPLADWLDLE
jgi:RNA polymerase sigma factor (sigma-70 family)